MTLHRWHWLDDGLLPILIVILRLCWLWPWLEMLRRWLMPSAPSPLLPIWLLFCLFVASANIARLALAKTQTLGQARAWVAGVGIVTILGVLWWQFAAAYPIWNLQWLWLLAYSLSNWVVELPPAFLVMLVTTGIWVRGVLDGRRVLTRDDTWSAFATGAIAFVLLLLAAQLDPTGLPPNTARWLVLFFMVGLSALALSSLELARITGRMGTHPQPQLRLNRYWLLSVGGIIAGVVVLALAVGLLLTPETVAQAFSWVTVVIDWLATIVSYLLFVVVYVLFLFLTPLIEWIRSQMTGAPPREPMQQPEFQPPMEVQAQSPVELSPLLEESLRWLWLVGLMAAAVLVIALALRFFRSKDEDGIEETREIIFSHELVQEQLASLWQKWRQRFQQASPLDSDPYLALDGEPDNRRSIRALYQALLAQAATLGFPRQPSQTPREYQTSLERSLLAEEAEEAAWRDLTEGYIQARYGLQAPSDEQVARARQAWARLHSVLESQQEATSLSAQPTQKGPSRGGTG